MVAHSEESMLESTIEEGAPTLAPKLLERPTMIEELSSEDVLREAQRLLHQVLCVLNEPVCERSSNASWSFRMARAHTLTLLDHLARMAEPR